MSLGAESSLLRYNEEIVVVVHQTEVFSYNKCIVFSFLFTEMKMLTRDEITYVI